MVNTQGWTKGLGEELMRAIETAAEPTHVFAFEADEPVSGAGWANSPVQAPADLPPTWGNASTAAPPKVFTLTPAPASPLQARYSGADMRALSTLSYMYAKLGEGRWDVSAPLFTHRPWVVTLGQGGPLNRAYLIGEGSESVSGRDLPLAFNASLVALVATDDPSATLFAENGVETAPAYVPGAVPPEDATCLGLALVRAVRTTDSTIQLQLLTPLQSSELARATAIVRNGALELPAAGMLDWRERVPGGGVPDDGLAGVRWEDVPFFDAAGSGAVGGDRRRFRKNLQRKNQQ